MGQLMMASNIAITAGGMTMFEACCMGLCQIVLPLTPFHESVASFLESKDMVMVATPESSSVRTALLEMIRDKYRRAFMAYAGHRAVNGNGAVNIARIVYNMGVKHAGG